MGYRTVDANCDAFFERLAEASRSYAGRYTHRVAISNSRLIALAAAQVSFRWRDYRHHDKNKVMTLAADEFIRRFLLHTLPDGFHRIRHYGFLANRRRTDKLALCRSCSWSSLPRRPLTATSVGGSPIAPPMSALAAAGVWNRSVRSRNRRLQAARLGTTAHERWPTRSSP